MREGDSHLSPLPPLWPPSEASSAAGRPGRQVFHCLGATPEWGEKPPEVVADICQAQSVLRAHPSSPAAGAPGLPGRVPAFGAAEGGHLLLGDRRTRDKGRRCWNSATHVLLCIFTRMLPGMSRALQLILAEHSLPAGGADRQGAGAEHEGTALGHGVHETLQGRCPGLSGTQGARHRDFGPRKSRSQSGRSGEGSRESWDGARAPQPRAIGPPTGRAALHAVPQTPPGLFLSLCRELGKGGLQPSLWPPPMATEVWQLNEIGIHLATHHVTHGCRCRGADCLPQVPAHSRPLSFENPQGLFMGIYSSALCCSLPRAPMHATNSMVDASS